MDKLQVGVIGAGKMGLLHMGIFNSLNNSNVVAICEKDDLIGRLVTKYLPKFNIYDDYAKMFVKENIDIVVITTPVFLHFSMIEEAMQQNIHIFVEKPLCLNGKECSSIISKKYNKKTQVGYCRRFMGTYSLAKKIISEKKLGFVNFFDSKIYVGWVFSQGKGWQYDPKKSGGGALIDLGSHAIDMIHYLFGDISSVHANGSKIFNSDVEDYVTANILMMDNSIGSLQISWSINNYRMPELKIDIFCERGKISVTEKYIEIITDYQFEGYKKGYNIIYKQEISPDVAINLAGPEYTLEDQELVDAIINNSNTTSNFQEAAKVNFVIDSIYNSISKQSVEKISYLV